eukprot:m51a1_g4851 putative peptide methionine sulfoxide reductase (161) ;mRNA; f:267380-267926
METAVFAAGCFWGVEKWFNKLFPEGIVSTRVGYTGGSAASPTYEGVCKGSTGHAEAVEVVYDPRRVRYEELLRAFWRLHDPTTRDRQGNDVGDNYRSAVFYASEQQRQDALRVMREAQEHWPRPIVTSVEPAGQFWPAEEYHQKYLARNPNGYCNHRLYW